MWPHPDAHSCSRGPGFEPAPVHCQRHAGAHGAANQGDAGGVKRGGVWSERSCINKRLSSLVLHHPCRRDGATKRDQVMNFLKIVKQVAHEDGFMMGDPVA